ncbi:sortase [Candidatus Dojkabacteria bacterium]|jgi:LPXTG-site transpeptidase (sortase) family protein|nr:sortase [Candidatus Dojkabacteria bacterium]
MIKILAKITSVALILLVIASILFFLVFPKYPDLKIYANQFNTSDIAFDSSLSLFTKISPPNQESVDQQIALPSSLEHISPDELARYKNEGKIQFNMEKQNTTLYIQSVNILGSVVDGENSTALNRGFWHFPLSGQPGVKGNTVIISHRFLHMPPLTDTFFNLDKVKVGDKVILNQKNGVYKYTVTEKKIVESNDRNILLQTGDYRLTLVTCTPLWTSEKRLVVIAKLDKIYGNT